MGQLHRLVDRHLGRHLAPAQLVDAEAEDVALDHGDPVHPPVLASPRAASASSASHVGDDAGGQRLGPIEHARLGTGEPGQTGRDASGTGGAPCSSQA